MVARRFPEKRRRLEEKKGEEEEKENMVMVRRVAEVEGRVQGGVERLEEEEREYGRLQGLLPHYRWKDICPQRHEISLYLFHFHVFYWPRSSNDNPLSNRLDILLSAISYIDILQVYYLLCFAN